MKEVTERRVVYVAYIQLQGQEVRVPTYNKEEFEGWLAKGKAPAVELSGYVVYTSARKVWRKIRRAEKMTVETTREIETIEL